jgi:hypothetical protein
VVTPDGPEAVRRQNLPCRVIPDPTGRVLQILGQRSVWYRMGRMPALLAVDGEGRVLAQHWGTSMRDTPNLEAVLDQLGW